jgi:ATP-dependent protease ClpP protease subunit
MKATNRRPAVRAALQPQSGTLEISIYGEIGANFFGDGITASLVKGALDQNQSAQRISVRINSPGGDAFEGLAIHNLLRSTGVPVEVAVDGIAASAASIIAMAGDKISLAKSAMLMIHNAWTIAIGDASEMRKTADMLDKISGSIAQVYVTRSGKTSAEVAEMLDAETWMSADDALELGFATDVIDDTPKALALAKQFKSLAKMKHLPEALKAQSVSGCTCQCEPCVENDCVSCEATSPCIAPGCTCENQPNSKYVGVLQTADGQKIADVAAVAVKSESNLSAYERRLRTLGK